MERLPDDIIYRVLIAIVAVILIFVLFYLGGAFSEASFNIKEWNENARTAVSMFAMLVSVIASGIIIVNPD